jgi:hypothetical protein
LYRELPGGVIENVYSLKLLNLDSMPHTYVLSVDGPEGIVLEVDNDSLTLASGAVERIPVRVHVSGDALNAGGNEIVFRVRAEDNDQLKAHTDSRFLGPMPRR